MQEVSKKEILISIEEQNKIEMLLSRIFEGIRVEVQHEYNNKGFNSDEATTIYRKMLANSELNSLINKLVEARINNLIKQAGIDDEKVEQIRNDILIASLEKFLSENSSPGTFASFGNSLNIACLKLMGKQDLLAKKDISIRTLNNIIDELSSNLSSITINMINKLAILNNCYDAIFNKTIASLTLYLECKENENHYLTDYVGALNEILENKYREEYKKTIQAAYKTARKEKLQKCRKTKDFVLKRISADVAYSRALEVCNQKIKKSYLGFNKSDDCCFTIPKKDIVSKNVSDALKSKLDVYTFISNLGRKPLTLEEIKAVEEKVHNYEIKNFDEAATILLNLRKKDNSDNNNK